MFLNTFITSFLFRLLFSNTWKFPCCFPTLSGLCRHPVYSHLAFSGISVLGVWTGVNPHAYTVTQEQVTLAPVIMSCLLQKESGLCFWVWSSLNPIHHKRQWRHHRAGGWVTWCGIMFNYNQSQTSVSLRTQHQLLQEVSQPILSTRYNFFLSRGLFSILNSAKTFCIVCFLKGVNSVHVRKLLKPSPHSLCPVSRLFSGFGSECYLTGWKQNSWKIWTI